MNNENGIHDVDRNTFLGLFLSLCAQLERCCIHGKGILLLYSFFEVIQWYDKLFRSLKLEMKIFQSIANPHRRPRPSSLFSFSAVQERSGWRDGFKTCDCSREWCALSEMRLRGCTSPSVTSECLTSSTSTFSSLSENNPWSIQTSIHADRQERA